jgi:hypothetical protein
MIYERLLLVAIWAMGARTKAAAALRREGGQGIMEYAILLGGIALVAGLAFYAAGGFDFGDMTDEIQSCISFENDCG